MDRKSLLQKFLFLFTVALLASNCSSSSELSCVYVPVQTKENPYPELTEFQNCGRLHKGTLVIDLEILKSIWFNEDGLADIRIHDGIYYINKKGKFVRTHFFDNGPDYFKEGLARTIQKNKFGFINKKLDLVISPQYDFAFPFNKGVAVVCNDCSLNPDSEHKAVIGGKWGKIDKTGKVIIEIKYTKQALESL